MRKLDLTRQVFGRLTVIEEAESYISPSGYKQTKWKCKCLCGNVSEVFTRLLRKGDTQSCGCLNKELRTIHSHSKKGELSKEYRAWQAMKKRCLNPNNNYYADYGGRGITIHPEWIGDFQSFYDYIGQAPDPSASIDRIDCNKNYEPGNVVWGTNQTQALRKRTPKNNTSGVKGVMWEKSKSKWKAGIRVNYKQIHLGYFDNKEDAIAARLTAEKKYHMPLLK